MFVTIKNKSIFNILNLILLSFSVINILQIFLPRIETQNSEVRLPVQVISLFVFIIMFASILLNKHKRNKVVFSVVVLIILIIVHFFYFFLNTNPIVFKDTIQYVRFLTWLVSIIFFYESFLKYGISVVFFMVYTFTFIISTLKQIFEASLFENDKLGGGDVASLPLLFIIPIALFLFDKQLKLSIILCCSIIILISLRRTAILSLLVCIPFFFNDLKSQLKNYQIGLFLLVILVVFNVYFANFWDLIALRFQELVKGGEDGSYGSGRSDFYLIVWNNWSNGDLSLIFGNGLLSVKNLLMKKSEYELTHAHNDFLEIVYTFGIVGLLVWINFIKSIWGLKEKVLKYSKYNLNCFYIVFLSFMIISISSGTILRIATIPFSINISLLMYFVAINRNSKLKFFN